MPSLLSSCLSSSNIQVMLVYRPPSNTLSVNTELVQQKYTLCESKEVILLGNLNLPALDWLPSGPLTTYPPEKIFPWHLWHSRAAAVGPWPPLPHEKKPGLETISWLANAEKRRKCVNVLQFCIVRTATTNQRIRKDRTNQSAARKLPRGLLIWWKSYSRCLPIIKLVQWYALSDGALFLAYFSIILLL